MSANRCCFSHILIALPVGQSIQWWCCMLYFWDSSVLYKQVTLFCLQASSWLSSAVSPHSLPSSLVRNRTECWIDCNYDSSFYGNFGLTRNGRFKKIWLKARSNRQALKVKATAEQRNIFNAYHSANKHHRNWRSRYFSQFLFLSGEESWISEMWNSVLKWLNFWRPTDTFARNGV